MYRDNFRAICIAIQFARIAILSANRGIICDDIHCELALTAGGSMGDNPRLAAMDKVLWGKPSFADVI